MENPPRLFICSRVLNHDRLEGVSKGDQILGFLYSIILYSSEPRGIHKYRIIKENMLQKFLGDKL